MNCEAELVEGRVLLFTSDFMRVSRGKVLQVVHNSKGKALTTESAGIQGAVLHFA